MKSAFIVLEGIDGCGKGEQIKLLQNYFFERDKRIDVFTTREPTYGQYGMQIRKLLKEEDDPMASAEKCLELYTLDRKEHNKAIKTVLDFTSGELVPIVLCDRYYHSTYAFQQTQGISFDKIHEVQKDFLKPTVTFLLDLKPEIALSRISNGRDGTEKFEKIDFMKKLRQNYLKLVEQLDEEIVVINASKSISEVFDSILKVLKEKGLA